MHRINASSLLETVQHAFSNRGVPTEDALDTADVLVETSLHGVDTHGVRLAPYYIDLLERGKAKRLPQLRFEKISQNSRRLHANRALGPVAGVRATREAIDLAKKFGNSMVWVRDSNHFGSAGYYARLMAKNDCVGMVFSNSDALVAPFAGNEAFFGTNPMAIAVPADNEETFCIDMATSQTSFSQVMMRKESNIPLEPGWAIDVNGKETLDASTSVALEPLGGFKGQGLAMAVEVLCTLLSGADFDHDLASVLDGRPAKHQSIGHFFICIHLAPLGSVESSRRRLGTLFRDLLQITPRGQEPIRFAGQRASRVRRERLATGVPISDDLLRELTLAARYLANFDMSDATTQRTL